MVKAKATKNPQQKKTGGKSKMYTAKRHNYAEADNATCFAVSSFRFLAVFGFWHNSISISTLLGQLLFEIG